MDLTLEQKNLMEQEINPLVGYANTLDIENDQDSFDAQSALKTIKLREKRVGETFDPICDAAHKTWKQSCDTRSSFLNPLKQAETIIKKKIVTFETEAERKRQEQARLAEAKRLEAERKEREKIEAQAKKAEEAGKTEKAEALREKAETVNVAPVFVPPPPPKVAGTSFKKVWKGQVVDVIALCKAIGEGKASPSMVIVSQSSIDAHARANRDSWPIPGVVFKEESQMAMRASS